MKKQATNLFIDGLVTDFHPLTAKNTTLTSALNATLVTTKGNEMVLQNDVGNIKIRYEKGKDLENNPIYDYVLLKEGFIPIGIKEYGGIIYIVSYHLPSTEYPDGAGEIGSFPSIEYDTPYIKGYQASAPVGPTDPYSHWLYWTDLPSSATLVWKYAPFHNFIGMDITDKEFTKTSNLPPGAALDLLGPFTTELFNFDLMHPVSIEVQASYDGSVNLILTDDKNPPRLINSGFSLLENGQVEIPNRRNNYDNIYTRGNFDLETSLIKRTDKFPKIEYNGVISSGNLKVGNYTLYLKYSDDDGNETDFVALSGMISIFKGNDADPFSIDGGVEDMNAYKSISIEILNIDPAYNNIKVYFTRTSSAIDSTRIPLAYVINTLFKIKDTFNKIDSALSHNVTATTTILITGDEDITQIPLSEITTLYFVSNKAKTLTLCQNMLFLGNVETTEVDYTNLVNISLRILPQVIRMTSNSKIGWVSPLNYKDSTSENFGTKVFPFEYYNTKNIYYNVGYWNEEYYRLGIVYILADNTKTPVFNIMGGELTNTFETQDLLKLSYTYDPIEEGEFSCNVNPLEKKEGDEFTTDGIIHINDLYDYTLSEGNNPKIQYSSTQYIYGIQILISENIINYLLNLGIKGCMIVRQKRIPTIAAQGYTLPWDKEAKIPIVTYYGPKRIGSLDKMVGLPSPEKQHDCYIDYLGAKKRRYFVESFLKQVGLEIPISSYLDVNNSEYFVPSKVENTYYSRLHHILDYMIDTRMVTISFDGEKSYIVNEYTAPEASLYIIFNEDPGFQTQEDIHTLLENTFKDFWKYAQLYSQTSNEEELVEYMLSSGHIENFSRTGIWLSRIYLSLESAINARDSLQPSYGTNPLNIYAISYYDLTAYTFKDADNRGIGPDWGPYHWTKVTDVMLDPPATTYYEKYLYNYTIKDKDGLVVATGSGEELTLSAIIDALNIVIDSRSVEDSETMEYTIERVLIRQDSLSATYLLVRINAPSRSIVTGKIDTTGDKVPRNSVGGYIQGTRPDDDNTVDINKLKLKDYRTDAYSFLGYDDKSLREYFLNRKFAESNVAVSLVLHYYNLYKYCNGQQLTAICPEFEVRLPYFNTLFTGAEYTVKYTNYQPGYLLNNPENIRSFYVGGNPNGENNLNALLPYHTLQKEENKERKFKLVSVTDNVPIVAIDNTIFKSVLGIELEAYRFSYINEEHCHRRDREREGEQHNGADKDDFNLVRGIYSPFLGIESNEPEFVSSCNFDTKLKLYKGTYNLCKVFNIYYPGTFNGKGELNNDSLLITRKKDDSGYYAISNINSLSSYLTNAPETLFRGDCFLCTFTHRVNRNFNDPTSPTNDHILDYATWNKNYEPDTKASKDKDKGIEKLNCINRGDINAVKLGSWITVKVKSSYNLSIRSLDESHILEQGIMGRARGFYPLQQASADGGFKIPNSYVINDAFGATVSEQYYKEVGDVPYNNIDYANRVVYSDVDVTGAIKNGYRIFRGTTLKDYTKQYGSITKLIERAGDIVCIFEHGVSLLKINEKAIGAESDGGLSYITANTVLPETPFVYSDMYGSQWAESVIKTPSGTIYGIDSARKKIWRLTSNFEIISDFRIEKFLLDNLTIGETDTLPYLGLKNIATHYNANKSDVMFTFYYKPMILTPQINDCGKIIGYNTPTSIEETEVAWNVCYNEILNKFLTFYSWIPIVSANVDNQFYSFNRECSREIITELEQYDNTENLNREWSLEHQKPLMTPYLWKHGPTDSDTPLPTHWYGELHPFEFEFIVNEEVGVQKIFNNLVIISNQAEPESFHFTINADGYDFSPDKLNMYFRQETTKELFRKTPINSHINYDEDKDLLRDKLNQLVKSSIFPLYYNRLHIDNDIYDYYTQMLDKGDSRDYRNLSGSEVLWDRTLNEFLVATHIKNTTIKDNGYLRGNSWYKEDRWNILIPSITVMLKNEDEWDSKHHDLKLPPIVVNPSITVSDADEYVIESTGLPNTYTMGDIDTTNWTFRKESKIRDKYCRVKIRYSGTKLAVISAIITTFTISYA